MNKVSIYLKKLSETTLGQKFMLLLSPFLITSFEQKDFEQGQINFFKYLHFQLSAPLLGSFFFLSALTFLQRTLRSKNYFPTYFINFESFHTAVFTGFLLVILSYSLAVAYYLAPILLNYFLKRTIYYPHSLSFWTTYYGGLLMFVGLLLWIPSLLLLLPSDQKISSLLLILIFFFLWWVCSYLHQKHQQFSKDIPYPESLYLKMAKNMILIILSGSCIFMYWKGHQYFSKVF